MHPKGRLIQLQLSDSIEVHDSVELKSFTGDLKKFIVQVLSGWFPSIRKDLSPKGVQKMRVIDRKNDWYHEKVIDVKTGRVIRDLSEKLSQHYKK